MVSFPLFDYTYYSIELLLMAKASGMSVYITSCTWTHFIFKSFSSSQTFVIRDLFAHMPGSHNTPIGPLLNSTLAAMSLKHPNQPKQFIEPSFRGRGASFVALAIHYSSPPLWETGSLHLLLRVSVDELRFITAATKFKPACRINTCTR